MSAKKPPAQTYGPYTAREWLGIVGFQGMRLLARHGAAMGTLEYFEDRMRDCWILWGRESRTRSAVIVTDDYDAIADPQLEEIRKECGEIRVMATWDDLALAANERLEFHA